MAVKLMTDSRLIVDIVNSFVVRELRHPEAASGAGEAKLHLGSINSKERFDAFFNNFEDITCIFDKCSLEVYLKKILNITDSLAILMRPEERKEHFKKYLRKLQDGMYKLEFSLEKFEDSSRYYIRSKNLLNGRRDRGDIFRDLLRNIAVPSIADLVIEKKGNLFIFKLKMREENFHPLNLILYGPPGTGKTYHAVRHALAIIEDMKPEDISLVDKECMQERLKEYKENSQIEFITFHPSYSYEDFIEGLKAKVVSGQVTYYIEDGVFKRIAKIASANPGNRFVIIIDEINRGNTSSIFGELITLIEEDKRKNNTNEMCAKLLYSKEEFSVPSNLYIIGTMNTVDRSIALIDIALRRRFEFEEIMPDPSLLSDIVVVDDSRHRQKLSIDLQRLLFTINERIEEELDRDHTIGHAYFLSYADNKTITLKNLNRVFKSKIIPLLQEYFYEDWEKIKKILNDKNDVFIKKKSNNTYDLSEKIKNLEVEEHEFVKIYEENPT